MPGAAFREIRESDEYARLKRDLSATEQRLDEILQLTTELVSSRPERAREVPFLDGRWRYIVTDPWPDLCGLYILFTIDTDDLCTLRWIECIAGDAATAGDEIDETDDASAFGDVITGEPKVVDISDWSRQKGHDVESVSE